MSSRASYLHTFDAYFKQAAASGHIVPRKSIQIGETWGIAGPRAGALEVAAGVNSGALLKALKADDFALFRQFIPWNFPGRPQVFMAGRYLRLEAAWPLGLAETCIPLKSMGAYPVDGGRWIAGRSERGSTIRPGLTQATPHHLISGTTGSGKSTALHAILLQLCRDPLNQFVLADGKYGSCLNSVQHLPGVVGPCAIDLETARNALGWALTQMRQRYLDKRRSTGRLVILIDEVQEFTPDAQFSEMLRQLVVQGRGAAVHVIAATHHPTVDLFGGPKQTKRMFLGRVCLLVSDAAASRVAVGAPRPRADMLASGGDSYVVAPGGIVHRVQLAWVNELDVKAAGQESWVVQEWPLYEAEQLGYDLEEVGWSYSGSELAQAQIAAVQDPPEGRGLFNDRLVAAGIPAMGGVKGPRLLKLGREAVAGIRESGYDVTACLPAKTIPIPVRCEIVDV